MRGKDRLPRRGLGPETAGVTISTISEQTESFVEAYADEDDHLAGARARSHEVGVAPVSPATGTTLRLLAALAEARSVVEVGTGTGVSGLWLLRGMTADGVLTSVDVEAEHQRLARQTFSEAGVPSQRFRLIPGLARDVLPRLTDAHYEMVVIDGPTDDLVSLLDESLRLLSGGGLVVFVGVLAPGVPDLGQRDPATTAVRTLLDHVRDDDRVRGALVPTGSGLLVVRPV